MSKVMIYTENILFEQLPQELQEIGGTSFTVRHIEVLCCLLNGKDNKVIAHFLSISEHTVAAHCNHMRQRANKFSRQHLIEFVEQSGKTLALKHYYLALKQKLDFLNLLKTVQQNFKSKPTLCFWQPCTLDEKKTLLLKLVTDHLLLSGFKIHVLKSRSLSSVSKEDVILACFSPSYHPSVQDKDLNLFLEKLQQGRTQDQTTGLVLLFDKIEAIEGFQDIKENDKIEFNDINIYFENFLMLVAQLIPLSANLTHQIENFKKNTSTFFQEQTITKTFSIQNQHQAQGSKFLYFVPSFFKMSRAATISLAVFCLISVVLLSKVSNPFSTEKSFEAKIKVLPELVRSDLPIPYEDILLERPHLVAQIDKNFQKSAQTIQTLVLTGIGGAGKTTVARQYGRQHKGIVWDINAETHASLRESFEQFADAFAQTSDEKKQLMALKEEKKLEERERKILLFVKERLKMQPDWLLIFDNVEKLTNIQRYFPTDQIGWGRGKVIVTTRNRHIEDHSWIQHALHVSELKPDEKLNLFAKILNKDPQYLKITPKETLSFLEALPSFPLDVSIAAHYLKDTHISYTDYIKNLYDNKNDFEVVQKNILEETSNYLETRYKIITLSLHNVIKVSKDFEDLLLFISLINASHIPKALLNEYKDAVVVDNFFHHLKKYSLSIENLSLYPSLPCLSIHKSTQNIARAYLIQKLTLKKEDPRFQPILDTLYSYMDQALEEEDFIKMKLSARHAENLVKYKNILSDFDVGMIESKLGCLYYFVDKTAIALKTFEHSRNTLDHLSTSALSIAQNAKLARSFMQMGTIYTELNDYDSARLLLEKSLQLNKHLPLDNPLELAWIMTHLANAHRRAGYYDKAKPLLEESLNIQKNTTPQNHHRMAQTLAVLGSVYRGLGNYTKAEEILKKSLQIYTTHFSKDHVRIGWVLSHLGNVARRLGQYEQSIKYFEQSLHIYKANYSESHFNIGLILTYLGNAYKDLKQYDKAKEFLEQGLKIYEQHFKGDHERIGRILFHLGTVYRNMGNEAQAKVLLTRALRIYEKIEQRGDIELGKLYRNMAEIHLIENRFEQAEQMYHKSLKILQQHHHPETYMTLENFADLYLKKSSQAVQQGKLQQVQELKCQAIYLLERALQTVESHFFQNSMHHQRINKKIKAIQEQETLSAATAK